MKKILFIDIEDNKSDMVVINKSKPQEIIYTIPRDEERMISSGIYKKYDNVVRYNGNIYYLSPTILKNISDIDISNIGITKRNIKKDYVIESPISGITNYDIAIIATSKINNIEEIQSNFLKRYDKTIDKKYTINNLNINDKSETEFKKMKIIISNLIGYKIINNRFSDLVCDRYDTVCSGISYKDIQFNLDQFLFDTTDSDIRNKIIDTINNGLIVETYIESNNKLNMNSIEKNEIKIPNIIKYL